MHQLSTSVFFLLIFAFTTASTPAFAQDEREANSNTVSAHPLTDSEKLAHLVKKGTEAFQSRNFPQAAQAFEKAFDLSPLDQLLKNAMVAWYNDNNCSESVRVAARLVAFVGKQDISPEGEKQIQKVITCALEEADSLITNHDFEKAKSILASSSAAIPSSAQREIIDNYWKKISLKGEPLTSSNLTDTPNLPNNETSINSGNGFYKAAPWISASLLAAGGGLVGSGVYFFTQEKPNLLLGKLLTGTGAVSLYASAAIFIYWLVTPPSPTQQEAFLLYKNTQYHQKGGLSTIEFSPTISAKQIQGTFQFHF